MQSSPETPEKARKAKLTNVQRLARYGRRLTMDFDGFMGNFMRPTSATNPTPIFSMRPLRRADQTKFYVDCGIPTDTMPHLPLSAFFHNPAFLRKVAGPNVDTDDCPIDIWYSIKYLAGFDSEKVGIAQRRGFFTYEIVEHDDPHKRITVKDHHAISHDLLLREALMVIQDANRLCGIARALEIVLLGLHDDVTNSVAHELNELFRDNQSEIMADTHPGLLHDFFKEALGAFLRGCSMVEMKGCLPNSDGSGFVLAKKNAGETFCNPNFIKTLVPTVLSIQTMGTLLGDTEIYFAAAKLRWPEPEKLKVDKSFYRRTKRDAKDQEAEDAASAGGASVIPVDPKQIPKKGSHYGLYTPYHISQMPKGDVTRRIMCGQIIKAAVIKEMLAKPTDPLPGIMVATTDLVAILKNPAEHTNTDPILFDLMQSYDSAKPSHVLTWQMAVERLMGQAEFKDVMKLVQSNDVRQAPVNVAKPGMTCLRAPGAVMPKHGKVGAIKSLKVVRVSEDRLDELSARLPIPKFADPAPKPPAAAAPKLPPAAPPAPKKSAPTAPAAAGAGKSEEISASIDGLYTAYKAWVNAIDVHEDQEARFPDEWAQLERPKMEFRTVREAGGNTPKTLQTLQALFAEKKAAYQILVDDQARSSVDNNAGTMFLQQRVDEYETLMSLWLPYTLENDARVAANDDGWIQTFGKTDRHFQALKQTLDAQTVDTQDWEPYDNQVSAFKLEIRDICDHVVKVPFATLATAKSPPAAPKKRRVAPAVAAKVTPPPPPPAVAAKVTPPPPPPAVAAKVTPPPPPPAVAAKVAPPPPPPAVAAKVATSPPPSPPSPPSPPPPTVAFPHLPRNWSLYPEARPSEFRTHVTHMKGLSTGVKNGLLMIMEKYPRDTYSSIYSEVDSAAKLADAICKIVKTFNKTTKAGPLRNMYMALKDVSQESIETFKVMRYLKNENAPAPDAPPTAAAAAAAPAEKADEADEADEAELAPPKGKGKRKGKGTGTARKGKGKKAPADAADAANGSDDEGSAVASSKKQPTPTPAATAPADESDDDVLVVKKKPSSIRHRLDDDSEEEIEILAPPAKKARTLPAAADAAPPAKKARTLPAAPDAAPAAASKKRSLAQRPPSDDEMDARIAAPTDFRTAFQGASAYDDDGGFVAAAAASTWKRPLMASAQDLLERVRANRALASSNASESAGGWVEVPHPAAAAASQGRARPAAAFQDEPQVFSGPEEEEEEVDQWGE